MKLYIESYQSKIEDLEEFEEKWKTLTKQLEIEKELKQKTTSDLNSVKSQLKETTEQLKNQEAYFKQQLETNKTKQVLLEERLKDLETFLITNRTYNASTEKGRPIKTFTNKIEAKNHKAELILLKDESWKVHKNSKIKYLLKGIPGGSVRACDDPDEALISFSELSTKVPDKSKPESLKKKVNPYKIEYFKNTSDVSDWGRQVWSGNSNSFSQSNYRNSEVEDKHKRSKSQTMNSIKSKKASKSQEQSFLLCKTQFYCSVCWCS